MQVGPVQPGADQVGAPAVLGPAATAPARSPATALARTPAVPAGLRAAPGPVTGPAHGLGADELAGAQQHLVDGRPVRRDVHLHDGVRALPGQALGLVQRAPDVGVHRAGGRQRQRLRQVPEQLVQLPDHREHREHLPRAAGGAPPVLPAEGDLRDLLARPEAVVDGAALEALLPELGVDAAAEVRLEVPARLPGVLVDREVRRGGEGQGHAAEPEAVRAVGPQIGTALGGGCGLGVLGHCVRFL